MSKAIKFTDLEPAHLESVRALLQQNGLPFEDCDSHIKQFIGIFDQKELIATGGFEVHDQYGLLRSVAVDSSAQGRGLGRAIVERLRQRARASGLQRFYLLTETAGSYFLALGYHCVEREQLPLEIKLTRQFQSLCPASAQTMVIDL